MPVTAKLKQITLAVLLSSIIAPAAVAQQGFMRILLPVAFAGELRGAFGSRWKMELQGRTFYPFPVDLTRTPNSRPVTKVSGSFTSNDLPAESGPIFLYVRDGDLITLNLRVRDVSREDQNWGTEFPLVTAEQTFLSAPIQLVAIPLDPRARQMLRVYDFDGLNGAAFNVLLVPRDTTVPTVERPYKMAELREETFPERPGYAEINLAELTPGGYVGLADLIITHPYGGPRLWVFVSITNNQTQLITTITPAFSGRDTVLIIP